MGGERVRKLIIVNLYLWRKGKREEPEGAKEERKEPEEGGERDGGEGGREGGEGEGEDIWGR